MFQLTKIINLESHVPLDVVLWHSSQAQARIDKHCVPPLQSLGGIHLA